MTVLALLTTNRTPRIIQEHLSHDLEYPIPSALVAGLISIQIETLKQIVRSCQTNRTTRLEMGLLTPQVPHDYAESINITKNEIHWIFKGGQYVNAISHTKKR